MGGAFAMCCCPTSYRTPAAFVFNSLKRSRLRLWSKHALLFTLFSSSILLVPLNTRARRVLFERFQLYDAVDVRPGGKSERTLVVRFSEGTCRSRHLHSHWDKVPLSELERSYLKSLFVAVSDQPMPTGVSTALIAEYLGAGIVPPTITAVIFWWYWSPCLTLGEVCKGFPEVLEEHSQFSLRKSKVIQPIL